MSLEVSHAPDRARTANARVEVGALLAQAQNKTGLSDFGDPWFLGPLERLVEAINAEAGLADASASPVQRIVQSLVDRLTLFDLLKNRPQIRDENVDVVGVILGLPRTGSTLLHRLLGSSPQLTSGYWWEMNFPMPLPGEQPGDPSPRVNLAKSVVTDLLREWPDFETIDPIDATGLCEEVVLLDKSFLSSTYDSILNVPSYGRWMDQADHRKAYAELRIWLQVVQSLRAAGPRRKWLLKSPHHLMAGLDGLLAEFPEARLIMTHRAVEHSLPSYCSMCASMTAPFSSTFRKSEQGAYWNWKFQQGLRKLMRHRAELPVNRFVDVTYEETTKAPLETAMRVMRQIGLEPTADDAAAFQACLDENRRDTRPSHRYDPREFGLTVEEIQQAFRFYTDCYLPERRA